MLYSFMATVGVNGLKPVLDKNCNKNDAK